MAASSASSSSSTARRCLLIASLMLLQLTPVCLASKPHALNLFSQSLALVTPPPLLLPYRNGPVLSGEKTLDVYIIWYGNFTAAQKAIVEDFIHSFSASSEAAAATATSVRAVNGSSSSGHAVREWWMTTAGYKDAKGEGVITEVRLAGTAADEKSTMGKTLTARGVEELMLRFVAVGGRRGGFPASAKAVYMVLTAADVYVDGFCLNSCGFHAYTFPGKATGGRMLPYAWVGNSEVQCAGQCAWPFAVAHFGPQTPPLRPPNGDVGVDGMVINVATVLAGAATNPFGTGYYQGDAADPLEAVSACTGIFGRGAYPGYPGELLTHSATGSSFNAHGLHGRRFLIPAMWNPASLNCVPL